MKLIKRYILGEFLKPFLWCFILFISLSWIIDLFEHLDEIAKAEVPLFVICDYYFSLTPFIFVKISPIIIILATIYTLNNFNRNNEIMAIKAIGINLWSIIWLFLGVGIFMSAVSFVVNEVVKPEASMHVEDLKEEYFKPFSKREINKIMNDITFYGSHNRIFVINSYDLKRQRMNNVTISEHNKDNQLVKQIVAKQAQWVDGYWIFYDCIISEYDQSILKAEPISYTEKVIIIDEKPKDIKRANILPQLMSYWRLKKYIRRLKSSGFTAHKELVVLYSKIAFPLANFIIVFFAVPFTLTQKRSGSALLGITMSIAVSFSYWGINAVSLSLGKIGVFPPLLAAWFTNLIFFFVGVGLVESIKK